MIQQQSQPPKALSVPLSSTQLYAQDGNGNSDPNATAKKAALEGVLQKIERSYGRGSIVKLGDADNMQIDCISTGALTLG